MIRKKNSPENVELIKIRTDVGRRLGTLLNRPRNRSLSIDIAFNIFMYLWKKLHNSRTILLCGDLSLGKDSSVGCSIVVSFFYKALLNIFGVEEFESIVNFSKF